MPLFNGIFSFELIHSNKNRYNFPQLKEVMNGRIYFFFLVIVGAYQTICELFLLRSTIEFLAVSCSAWLWKAVIVLYFVHFCHRKGRVIN